MTKENESESSVGACFKRLLEATGSKNQTELAKILDITPQSVSGAIKRGRIPGGWYEIVSAKFGVSADWLLFGNMQRTRVCPDGSPVASEEILQSREMELLQRISDLGQRLCAKDDKIESLEKEVAELKEELSRQK